MAYGRVVGLCADISIFPRIVCPGSILVPGWPGTDDFTGCSQKRGNGMNQQESIGNVIDGETTSRQIRRSLIQPVARRMADHGSDHDLYNKVSKLFPEAKSCQGAA